jgi:hypothetical protein
VFRCFAPRNDALIRTVAQVNDAADMSPKLAALAAWFVVTAFFGSIGGHHLVPQLVCLYDLGKSNGVTLGEVIEIHPEMHDTCKYRFSWEGRAYENGGRSCGNDRVGQQIAVYFSPNEPSKSINGDPLALFWNDLIPFVAGLTLFPIFAALVVYQGTKRRA